MDDFVYGSVCSGIEAATVAWEPLGWKAAFYSEIDKFPSRVLAHHYPDVPNAGDFTAIQDGDYAAIDLLVGGTPCQAFSVAGLRAGLDDPRGNLTIEYARLAGRLRPRWLVWENVPGVLSIDGGRTFGTFLGMLGELGYGVAYRVLDAQHFGVPQRRRRVFVVGHLGDWRRAGAVLFERHSLSGHPAPRREKGKGVTGIACRSVASSLTSNYGKQPDNSDSALGPNLVASTGDIAHCLNAGGMGRQDFETETLLAVGGFPDTVGALQTHHTPNGHGCAGVNSQQVAAGHVIPVPIALQAGCVRENPDSGPDGVGVREDGIAYTLEARAEVQAVAFSCKDHGADAGDMAPTLRSMGHAGSHPNAGGQVAVAMNLRGREGGAMPELDDVASIRAASGGSSRSYVMYEQEEEYASTYEADASSILSTMRKAVGEKAVAEWGSRVLDSLQSTEVLRPWLHGESLRRASSEFRSFMDDSALPRPQDMPEGVLRTVWILGPNGRTSQGRGLAKQLARQLGKALPELPPARASEDHRSVMAVRRLTPKECERLMGFPDDYTKLSGKTADGPRYKALGNSMAVPVMRWIGERIKMVERLG